MTRPQRVFIDTSELFPFTIMDVLLTMAEDFLFTWVWTDEVIEEWEDVIVREGQRSPESAASGSAAVRHFFGDYRIDPKLYRAKITDELSPDPDDRVHAAAAMYGDMDVLLTRNMRHLSTAPVLAAGVKVCTSDDFLTDLLASRQNAVLESFHHAAASKQRPPVAPEELAQRISAAGAPKFSCQVLKLLSQRA